MDEKAKITAAQATTGPQRRTAACTEGILGATTEGERREPGASPGRSRRCEGRSRAELPLARGPGRRRGGRPESEDLPLAGHSEPLAEGGFVRKTLFSLAALVALAALLVPSALAARVSVQVEGRTLSLFGSLETRFEAGANPCRRWTSPACAASSLPRHHHVVRPVRRPDRPASG